MDDHDKVEQKGKIDDLEQLKNKASSAEMGEASLGGVAGLGTLHVVRDQEGGVFEVAGTWRLRDDADDQDIAALQNAYERGAPLVYKGRLSDAEHPDKDYIETEVTISSVQTYLFDATEDSPNRERTLYNYDLKGTLSYLQA